MDETEIEQVATTREDHAARVHNVIHQAVMIPAAQAAVQGNRTVYSCQGAVFWSIVKFAREREFYNFPETTSPGPNSQS